MCNRVLKTELKGTDRKEIEKLEKSNGIDVLEVARTADGIRPTLINGEPVDREDWPDVVRINRSCTATLVGSNCAITAAHCGDDGDSGTLELHDGSEVRFTVIQMPQYRDGANFDLSVLRLRTDVDVPFAEVGLDHEFTRGQRVLLAGYGCTRIGGGGGNDGILRIGPSRIVGESGTDIVSEWREQNGAALCFGDSGGPMFISEARPGSRVLIAVNSKGNIRDTNYNMRLDLAEVREFLTEAAERYDLEITGLNSGGSGGGDARRVLNELVAELNDVKEKVRQLQNVIE